MAGFDTNVFNNSSDDFDYFTDEFSDQNLSSLTYCPGFTSTSSNPSVAPQGPISGSYIQGHAFYNDSVFGSAQDPSIFTVPHNTGAHHEDLSTQNFPQVFLDAGNQHFAAHAAIPSQPSQQLQASIMDSRMAPELRDGIQGDLQEISQPIELTPPDENAPFRCGVLDCPEQQPFPTKAALKRHQDKHIRPYYCQHASCNRKNFGDKGGLDRHTREVHGSQSYRCPVRGCKRHKKGFHRRYNLAEHQRRAHDCSQPSDPFLLRPRGGDDAMEDGSEGDYGRTPTPQSELLLDGGDVRAGRVQRNAELNSGEDLRTKLRTLRTMRAELDEDIRSMERALSIMGGESP